MRIWDILIFICECKGKNQPLYPDNAPQKHKNYLRKPVALTKALANVSILFQILIGSLEPVQLQNKHNPKQKEKKSQTKKKSQNSEKLGNNFSHFYNSKIFPNSFAGLLSIPLGKTSFLELCCLSLWSHSTDLSMYADPLRTEDLQDE